MLIAWILAVVIHAGNAGSAYTYPMPDEAACRAAAERVVAANRENRNRANSIDYASVRPICYPAVTVGP